MIKLFLKWIVLAGAVLLAAYVIPGITVSGFVAALLVALVLGLLNLFVKPILKLITLPINFITLGLVGALINVGLFWLSSYLVAGFSIAGFLPAVWGALIVGGVMVIVDWFL